MTSPPNKMIRFAVMFSWIFLLSCRDHSMSPDEPIPVVPTGEGGVGIGRPMLVTGSSFSGSIPITSQYTNNGSVTLGSYTNNTLVHITVSGLVDQIWNSPPSGMNPQPQAGDLNLNYNVRGAYFSGGCVYGMKIRYGNDWYDQIPPSGCNASPAPNTEEVVSWYMVLVPGTVKAIRMGAPNYTNSATGLPMFRYAGDYDVDIEWVQADAKVTASTRAITAGTQVTFTASVTPTQAGGVNVPFNIVRWRWKPDVGAEVNPACPANPTCNYSPTKSGTMFVDVLVNGVSDTKSVDVDVFSCLTGDSIMDNPDVRKGLRDAWAGTGYPGPAASRLERGGGLHCDANNVCTPLLYNYLPATDNACRYQFTSQAGGGRYYWHMHPFDPLNPNDACPHLLIVLSRARGNLAITPGASTRRSGGAKCCRLCCDRRFSPYRCGCRQCIPDTWYPKPDPQ
jgi:hypothetical protein